MQTIILGISASTRFVGAAVQRNGVLIDWRMQKYQEEWSEKKRKRILHKIEWFIEKHQVDVVTLKTVQAPFSSPELKQVISGIKRIAKKHQVEVFVYSTKDMKEYYVGRERINKKKLIREIALRNPELQGEYDKESYNLNSYYLQIFEAVGSIELYQAKKENLT